MQVIIFEFNNSDILVVNLSEFMWIMHIFDALVLPHWKRLQFLVKSLENLIQHFATWMLMMQTMKRLLSKMEVLKHFANWKLMMQTMYMYMYKCTSVCICVYMCACVLGGGWVGLCACAHMKHFWIGLDTHLSVK